VSGLCLCVDLCSPDGHPHRGQQTIPQRQRSSPPRSFFTPTDKAHPDQAALATSAEARGATHRARPRSPSQSCVLPQVRLGVQEGALAELRVELAGEAQRRGVLASEAAETAARLRHALDEAGALRREADTAKEERAQLR